MGESIELPGSRSLRPEDVLGPSKRGRKLAMLGDTNDSRAIAGLACGEFKTDFEN
eukprot:SAG31_NODE_3003_length_4795_cov_4.386499_4_plen_55_part_00